jgi:hypothetical protein
MSDAGPKDYLALGDWNARCDRCGKKMKGSELRKTWQGFMVCPEHWEPRQPQDFVKSVPEHPTPPFVRNPGDIFLEQCTFNGLSAIPGYASPGCMTPGRPTINTD